MTVQYARTLRCIARTWSAGFFAALSDAHSGAEATIDLSKRRQYTTCAVHLDTVIVSRYTKDINNQRNIYIYIYFLCGIQHFIHTTTHMSAHHADTHCFVY